MNTLILSCSTGEGHNSAANAIYEELKKRNENVFIKDALSFTNKEIEKVIKSFFNGIALTSPNIFGIMYKAGAVVSNKVLKSPVYLANLTYAEKLYKYIMENNIDIVICTHLFPMEALTFLKKTKKINAKYYGLLTDYTKISFIEETELDGYFIPHKDLEIEFIKKGIMKSKIHCLGIPVSNKFKSTYTKTDARKILSLPIDKKVILIMGGGIGCGNITDMARKLTCKVDSNTIILVLTGKNKRLEEKIKNEFNIEKVKPIAFTKRVEIFMDASDILLSKPGGLSSTEAAVKEIPLIHTMPIPGCETENAKFFENKKMSIKATSLKEVGDSSIKLIKNKSLQEKLKKNQNKYVNKNASSDIVNYILTH